MTGIQKRIFKIKHYILYFLRRIFGFCFSKSRCLCCGNLSYGELVCKKCRNEKIYKKVLLPEAFFPRCRCCGKFLLSEKNVCMECRKTKIINSADFVFPVFQYRLYMKNILFMWKTMGVRSFSYIMAFVYAVALRHPQFKSFRTLVPVPPRPGKIRKKGWDQMEEVSQYLESFYGYDFLRLLERKSKIQQKKKNRISRVSGERAFIPSKYCKKLKDKNLLPAGIVLIDDVITTGSTVEQCAAVLKEAGVKEIKVLSAFIVD